MQQRQYSDNELFGIIRKSISGQPAGSKAVRLRYEAGPYLTTLKLPTPSPTTSGRRGSFMEPSTTFLSQS